MYIFSIYLMLNKSKCKVRTFMIKKRYLFETSDKVVLTTVVISIGITTNNNTTREDYKRHPSIV